jgi:diguanylate cyclase (GGDEF)-like protein
MGLITTSTQTEQQLPAERRLGFVWGWLRNCPTPCRVLIIITLVMAVILTLAGYTTLGRATRDIRAMLHQQADLHLGALVQDISPDAQQHHYHAIEEKLKAGIRAGDLQELEFITPEGGILSPAMPVLPADRPPWFARFVDLGTPSVSRALWIGGEDYGRVSLKPSPRAHEDYLWHMMIWWMMWASTGLALVGGAVSYLLKINLKDLFSLQQAARRIALGEYHPQIAVSHRQPPELRETIGAFNLMGETLKTLLCALNEQTTALSQEKERWQVTLSSINDGVVVTDEHNCVIYLNPAAEVLLEIPQEGALSAPIKLLLPLDDREQEEFNHFVQAASIPNLAVTGTICFSHSASHKLSLSCSCSPFNHRNTRGAIYVLRDETEKKQLVDNLRLMAFHDSLTTLPNRRAVEGRLERALRTAKKDGLNHVFCYIDLDQFKLINDTCGHSAGDLLLASLAKRMGDEVPVNAYLGRLGGDEFGLILFDAPVAQARAVCHRLIKCIQGFRFTHHGRSFSVGACAGITRIDQSSRSLEEVMIQADMACYRAKAEGSGLMRVYEADEIGFRRLQEEMGLAAEFTQALEAGRFLPYRQLIQAVSPQGQSHYEVLVRIKRPSGEIDGPGKLLPALERYGQAPILDRWMLESVIAYLSRQPEDQAVYFINLSGKTLADETFLATACELFDRYQLPGSRIGFEITETAAVVNLNNARTLIEGLRGKGCRFGLDDFGREASSFSYLKHLPADYIKIDGSFVHRMVEDKQDQAIVRSIIQLSKDFGLLSVAEHVENAQTAALLGEIGVDYLQGYHVHRPEPLPDWEVSRLPSNSTLPQETLPPPLLALK